MIVYSKDNAKQKWPGSDQHDPDSIKDYAILYRPPEREDNREYIQGVDVVTAPVPNGCMYECVSGGISAPEPPAEFPTVEGETFHDGDVEWLCLAIRSRLSPGDHISASSWVASHEDITLMDPIIFNNDTATAVLVADVPADLKEFEITNTIEVDRVSGRHERFDKTLIVKVKSL